jgi:hypothetical protein
MMTEREPTLARLLTAEDTTTISWAEARQRLSETQYYWLATIGPDGPPHVRPVLAIWLDGSLYTTTNAKARKGRNLMVDSRCSVAARSDDLDLVLEGRAARVTDEPRLEVLATEYRSKYPVWPVVVGGAAFDEATGAPTAGPPPYQVYELSPTVAFAFGTDEALGPRSTRWSWAPTKSID